MDQLSPEAAPIISPPANIAEAADILEKAHFEIKRWIVGQDEMLERVLVALLGRGHILLEGVPGLAKTLTVKTVAAVFGGEFRRIQFTPDLVPADLTGTRVLDPKKGEFRIELGPVFANFLLADEINRAPAKVQSALLEVMQERQVTIAGEPYEVPYPFIALATQNPIETEGTYALPEAQVDRFMLKVLVGYPDYGEELEVVERASHPPAPPRQILTPEVLAGMQALVDDVYVDLTLKEYAVTIVTATRQPARFGVLSELRPYIEFGASPRASIYLVLAAKALAMIKGRDYVIGSDMEAIVHDVLRHRIVLSYRALAEDVTTDDIIKRVCEVIPAPQVELREAVGQGLAPEVPKLPTLP